MFGTTEKCSGLTGAPQGIHPSAARSVPLHGHGVSVVPGASPNGGGCDGLLRSLGKRRTRKHGVLKKQTQHFGGYMGAHVADR